MTATLDAPTSHTRSIVSIMQPQASMGVTDTPEVVNT